MSTPILCLDGLILAATAYPSGFSYSLFTSWNGAPRGSSTSFLGFLALPYLLVCPVVVAVQPNLLALHGTNAVWVVAALLLTPVVMALEFAIHGTASYRATGRFPTWFGVHPLARGRLSATDHVLLGIVVMGEEFIYRGIWIAVLHRAFGLPLVLALFVSSFAYGMNHIAFGGITVLSKTVSGLLFGSIFLLGGQCLWLPILTHAMQNIALFGLARESHA
jgi:hypothetical protein